jgi:hypothetical protein
VLVIDINQVVDSLCEGAAGRLHHTDGTAEFIFEVSEVGFVEWSSAESQSWLVAFYDNIFHSSDGIT